MFSTGINVVLAKITIIGEQSIRFAEPVFQFVQCFEHRFDALLVIGFRGQARDNRVGTTGSTTGSRLALIQITAENTE
ncbi:MAG: hypothetical protein Q8L82_07310 [Nitrosomonas sp.]|nr:hypothetical protein [Nitrosomonas sp.]